MDFRHIWNKWLATLFLLSVAPYVIGQNPVANFSAQATACLNEELIFGNSSTNATQYIWDFCHNDLNSAPSSATQISSTTFASLPMGITVVYDAGNWYGFLTSRESNKLYRINFGNSLDNMPAPADIYDLGNVGGILSGPKTLRFVQEGSIWYAIGINVFGNSMFRLVFSAGLGSTPTGTQVIGNLASWNEVEGLDLANDGTNWIAIISSYTNNKISMVRIGSSITNTPTGADVLTLSGAITTPFGSRLYKEGANWYGLITSYAVNKVYRLNFGANLFSIPTVDDVYTASAATTNVSIQKEGNEYHAFVATKFGSIQHLNFGNSLSNVVQSNNNLGGYGVLSRVEGFDFVRSSPVWYAFAVDYSTGHLQRIKFQGSCPQVSAGQSVVAEPKAISYGTSGNYFIELTAISATGETSNKNLPITIINNTAPTIDFLSGNNSCLGQMNTFTSIPNDASISSFNWDFGDGNTGTGGLTTHQFALSGTYPVRLQVVAANGCGAKADKAISIYNAPAADFNLPTNSPLCTNQQFTFTNTTAFDIGSNPSWEWFVDGVSTASTKDLNHAFPAVLTYAVKLTASIPGCQTEITKSLSSLSTGPAVDFSYTNNCYLKPIQFTNLSSGSGISGQTWDFGDGIQAMTLNASHTFASAGNYDVILTVTNGTGCSNFKTVTIPVNDQPLIDFSYTSAVENVPITFTGQDLTLSDDLVTSWAWDFNSLGVSNANPSNFTFNAPSTNPVKLTAVTQQGCDFEVIKSVVVLPSTKPIASFSMGSQGCLSSSVAITNTSMNASNYVWDFCESDLQNPTVISMVKNIPTANIPLNVTMVYDQRNWYGFVSSRENNKLFRLDFGSSIENPNPTLTDLGNVNSVFSKPKPLHFVQEAGTWYAIGMNDANMFRLTFSGGLNSIPTGVNIGNLDTWNEIEGLDVAYDGTNWIGIVSSAGNNKMTLINFGTSITNSPSKLTILSGMISDPFGVKLFSDSGQWYGLVSSYSGKSISRLRFGATLFSVPSLDAGIYATPTSPTAVSIQNEGGNYYGFIATATGDLHRISFGNSLNNVVSSPQNLGNFGALNHTEGFELVRGVPFWYGFFISYIDNSVYRLKFQGNCSGVSSQSSTVINPTINYSQPGSFFVELTAYHNNGNYDVIQKPMTIQNKVSPDIDFTIDNDRCLGVENTFTPMSISGGIQDYAWTFGDGGNALTGATNYTYGSAGSFTVNLTIQGTNGCSNSISKPISIYNSPQANFTLPTNNPLCTNQLVTFPNTTTFDVGSNPSWSWFINGSSVSSTKDLQYAFTSTSTQNIKLRASIPGCLTENSQNISSLLTGPNVAFDAMNGCGSDPVVFTNLTTDVATGYVWDFGDTQTTNSFNSTHVYSNLGSYTVTLTGSSANGCQNTATKNISIYSKPQTDFLLSLPPFSCSGSPSQFSDLTPNPTDSNLNSWLWDFGDATSTQNTSLMMNPQHTYANAGDYSVSLTVTTNFNCATSIQKTVSIAQAPDASFTNSPVCVGQGVTFYPQKGQYSYYWQIGNTFYYFENPTYVFSSVGDNLVNFTITSNNNCVATSSKVLKMPNTLTPDFSIQNNCKGQNATFVDITTPIDDPISNHNWNFGGSDTGTGSPVAHTFENTGNFNITMKITTNSGCVYSVEKPVAIVLAPIASFTSSPETGAPPLTVKFTNNSTNATVYLWSFHDVVDSTSVKTSPQFIFRNYGDYVVDLTASNSQKCSNTFSKIITVGVPIYDVSLTAFTLTKNDDGSWRGIATLKNNGNGSIANLNLSVDLSGNATIRENVTGPIAPNQMYNHVINDEIVNSKQLNYICAEVELANDLKPENNKKCTNITEQFFLYDAFPNPAVKELNINWIADSKSKVTTVSITLTDAMGKNVLVRSFESVTGLNQILLPVDNLSSGFYILTTEAGSVKKTQRITVIGN